MSPGVRSRVNYRGGEGTSNAPPTEWWPAQRRFVAVSSFFGGCLRVVATEPTDGEQGGTPRDEKGESPGFLGPSSSANLRSRAKARVRPRLLVEAAKKRDRVPRA